MKLGTLTMAVVAACAIAQSAQARGYHHHRYTYHHYRYTYRRHEYRHYARRHVHAWRYAAEPRSGYAGDAAYRGFGQWSSGYPLRRTAYRGGYGPRPAAWCGWYMRQLLGVANPAFNLARNWAHWGHAGGPGVGAVVVWPHHVGKIVGREGGEWVIQSGNDGHAVRTRPRSIAGAIAVRWG
jgi:hypothetical protein